MYLTGQSVEYWEQNEIYSHIAKCTRVCYQTTPKKLDEDDKIYVNRVLLHSEDPIKNHGAMLEHGTVYLVMPIDKDSIPYITFFSGNPYSSGKILGHQYYVTTNMRVIIENHLEDLLSEYNSKITEHHEPRYTFSFITNIGISRELNRHRTHSMVEESTRYCNYTKEKFGKNITYIRPYWMNDSIEGIYNNEKDFLNLDTKSIEFMKSLLFSETQYNLFVSTLNMKPQDARGLLPLDIKTQVIHTAFKSDWEHFLDLRYFEKSGKVHPDMKVLATLFYDCYGHISSI